MDELFNRFWQAYPRKTAKVTAKISFTKLNPTEEMLQVILARLDISKQSEQWLKDDGQFIPHPATWLNQRRFEDETISATKATKWFWGSVFEDFLAIVKSKPDNVRLK